MLLFWSRRSGFRRMGSDCLLAGEMGRKVPKAWRVDEKNWLRYDWTPEKRFASDEYIASLPWPSEEVVVEYATGKRENDEVKLLWEVFCECVTKYDWRFGVGGPAHKVFRRVMSKLLDGMYGVSEFREMLRAGGNTDGVGVETGTASVVTVESKKESAVLEEQQGEKSVGAVKSGEAKRGRDRKVKGNGGALAGSQVVRFCVYMGCLRC